jgi:hypothetical protein
MPVLVPMPDGSEYRLTRLLSAANHKQQKGWGFLSTGLTLTPRATSRSGLNLCPNATRGCAGACFAGFDRLAWWQNKRAAVARSRLLAAKPAVFSTFLRAELLSLSLAAMRRDVKLVCRLNVVSDYPFERAMPEIFREFPEVQFMDYTKDVARVLGDLPSNYDLTFSRSESNEADCRRVLQAGHNVTVVFRTPAFPATFWGYPVFDGDLNDFRFMDPRPCVVGLKAKGKGAREDRTGFVIDARVPLEVLPCPTES